MMPGWVTLLITSTIWAISDSSTASRSVETDEGDDRAAKIEGCETAFGGRLGFHQIAARSRKTSTMSRKNRVMSGSP